MTRYLATIQLPITIILMAGLIASPVSYNLCLCTNVLLMADVEKEWPSNEVPGYSYTLCFVYSAVLLTLAFWWVLLNSILWTGGGWYLERHEA